MFDLIIFVLSILSYLRMLNVFCLNSVEIEFTRGGTLFTVIEKVKLSVCCRWYRHVGKVPTNQIWVTNFWRQNSRKTALLIIPAERNVFHKELLQLFLSWKSRNAFFPCSYSGRDVITCDPVILKSDKVHDEHFIDYFRDIGCCLFCYSYWDPKTGSKLTQL